MANIRVGQKQQPVVDLDQETRAKYRASSDAQRKTYGAKLIADKKRLETQRDTLSAEISALGKSLGTMVHANKQLRGDGVSIAETASQITKHLKEKQLAKVNKKLADLEVVITAWIDEKVKDMKAEKERDGVTYLQP